MIEFTADAHPEDPSIRVVTISGKLDNESSEHFFLRIEEEITQGHKQLILDCSNLDYISSMGLGSLMRTHSRLKQHMGDVKIAAMQPFVAETFRAVGFEKILELHDSVSDAQASFTSA